MNENENIRFDCNRGCTVTRGKDDALVCHYRQGCCKLEDYNYLKGVSMESISDIFEVRFKNTRKGFYRNASGQSVKTGDMVIVEAQSGHDLGIVTLEGPLVGKQMKCCGLNPETAELKRIYRKAKSFDIEKWQEAISREHSTMIRARQIASELGLEMKIGDVEFQGDGTKAIFYYIADGRVDFRQLIKVFAEEFRIRIEMKQIGARQEAGLIGGLGVCGRELCCANYITSFKSISTSAARTQDLSLNPQKLAGQCGKLKCCLNYEVANYMDAHSRIPKLSEPLELEDGQAFLVKTDILSETMYFSYEKGSMANTFALSAGEVVEIIRQNRSGVKPSTLKRADDVPAVPQFVSAVGDESISRFDSPKKKKKKNRGAKARPEGGQGVEAQKQGGDAPRQQAPGEGVHSERNFQKKPFQKGGPQGRGGKGHPGQARGDRRPREGKGPEGNA